VNPWWLSPPADEKPSKDDKPDKSDKAEKRAKSSKPKKAAKSRKSKDATSSSSSAPSAKPSEKKGDAGQRRDGRKRSGSRRRKPSSRGPRQLAVYCDAQSIAVAMRSVDVDELDLELILSQLASRGQVTHKKAYGDWHRLGDLEEDFRSAGFEVIDVPPARHSSNMGMSIPLALDAMELCYSDKAPDTFVIFSAEAELTLLIEKLKGTNRQVVGLGLHDATLPVLAEACDEFIFYNEMAPSEPAGEEQEPVDAEELRRFSALVEVIDGLRQEGAEIIWGAKIKRQMRQLQPEFDVNRLGYATFSEFLEDADRHRVIHLERDDRSGSYYVAGSAAQ
jgi:uncharacterized LabA/DUF88 family protein